MRLKNLLTLAAFAIVLPFSAIAQEQDSTAVVTDSASYKKAERLERFKARRAARLAQQQAENDGDKNLSPVPGISVSNGNLIATSEGFVFELDDETKSAKLISSLKKLDDVDAISDYLWDNTDLIVNISGVDYILGFTKEIDLTPYATIEHNSKTYTFNTLGFGAFEGNMCLTKVKLPSTIRKIETQDVSDPAQAGLLADYGTSVSIKNVSALFANCVNLQEIDWEIDNSITDLGALVFKGCLSLNKFNLPANLTEIGSFAFAECYSVPYTFDIPSTVEKIGSCAFVHSSIASDADYNTDFLHITFLNMGKKQQYNCK